MTTATDILKAPHVGVRDLRIHLADRLKTRKPIVVTDHGAPKKIILEYGELVELIETLEDMQNPGLLRAIQESRKAIAEGKEGIPVTHLFKRIQSPRK